MAKIKKVEEEEIEKVGPDKFPKEDADRMRKLWKTAGLSPSDVTDLVILYRRYVNANQPSNNLHSGCSNCAGSIQKIYEQLRNWFSSNSELFEN